MNNTENNKQPQQGIAVDLDDTVSDTLVHFIDEIQKKFNNPENLKKEEIAKKYGIMNDIPYWQTPEIKEWLLAQSLSNDAQEAVAVMPEALETIKKIHEIFPVRMYLTSRPSIVEAGTKKWLQKNGFPDAPLVTRPMSKLKIDGNAWKAEILEKAYPEIVGIIDDNPEIITAFSETYRGTVYLFGKKTPNFMTKINVIGCPTWKDVYIALSSKSETGMV